MRKIEQKMIEAIKAGKNWNGGNTTVTNEDIGIVVRLFGNEIGHIPHTEGRKLSAFIPNHKTYLIWNTPTTTSRLRALGVNAEVKDHSPHINGEPVANLI